MGKLRGNVSNRFWAYTWVKLHLKLHRGKILKITKISKYHDIFDIFENIFSNPVAGEPDKLERPPTVKEPQPPPLPARRESLPATAHVRAHLEPPMTLHPATLSILPVELREASVGQHVTETSQDEGDDNDDNDNNDELNCKVDVCGTSMLEYVLQAANSLSKSHDDEDDDDDVVDDDAISQQQQQQQQLNNDNNNVGNDDGEPLTTNTSGLNFLDATGSGSSNLEVIHQSL